MITPIVLYASSTVLPGQNAVYDANALQAPYRRPMLIDEVRFLIDPPAGMTGANCSGSEMGGSIRCRLRMGRVDITQAGTTNGFVPVWGFDASTQRLAEVVSAFGSAGSDANLPLRNYYRWRFSKPMYVPAGGQLIPYISRQPTDIASVVAPGVAVRVQIAIAGRLLDPGTPVPKTIDVPFACSYIDLQGAAPGRSSDFDLVNVFDGEDLNVTRLVGRLDLLVSAPTGTGAPGKLITQPYETDYTGFGPIIGMSDSNNDDIIKNASSQFNNVFSAVRRDWKLRMTLKPAERLYAKVDGKVLTGNQATYMATPAGAFVIPHVTMIGYRTMPTEEL